MRLVIHRAGRQAAWLATTGPRLWNRDDFGTCRECVDFSRRPPAGREISVFHKITI